MKSWVYSALPSYSVTLSQEPRSNAAQGATGSQANWLKGRREQERSMVNRRNPYCPEDQVHCNKAMQLSPRPKLNLSGIQTFDRAGGVSYIRETCITKSQSGLPARTQLQGYLSDNGGTSGWMADYPVDPGERITGISATTTFTQSLLPALQVREAPTLSYVDTVMKISSTYGVSTTLFDSIQPRNLEHNRLNDLWNEWGE